MKNEKRKVLSSLFKDKSFLALKLETFWKCNWQNIFWKEKLIHAFRDGNAFIWSAFDFHFSENCCCQAQGHGHLSTPFNSCEVYKPQRGPWDKVCILGYSTTIQLLCRWMSIKSQNLKSFLTRAWHCWTQNLFKTICVGRVQEDQDNRFPAFYFWHNPERREHNHRIISRQPGLYQQ